MRRSVAVKLVIAALVIGLTIAIAAAVLSAREAREGARVRCNDSKPAFPARVVRVDVDLSLPLLDYDCVYRLYHGFSVRKPPCPQGSVAPAT